MYIVHANNLSLNWKSFLLNGKDKDFFLYKIQYISSASKETENIKILTDDPERQKYQ